MARLDYIKLAKTRDDGKAELLVRFYISKTFRPQFRSGLFIVPQRFISLDSTDRCRHYEIDIPKKGKLNLLEVKELEEVKRKFSAYLDRLQAVCDVTSERHKDELTTDWINNALRLINDVGIPVEEITYQGLVELAQKEQKRVETERLIAEKRTIYEMVEEYLGKKDFSYDQVKGVRALMRSFARFEAFQQTTKKSFPFDVDTMTRSDIEDFREYLADEAQLSSKYPKLYEKLFEKYPIEIVSKHKTPQLTERGKNTVIKHMKRFKAFFSWMIGQGYTKNRPFEGLKIGTETYGTPVYITIEERNIIADTDLSAYPELEVQRDIFVFQCIIGCRVGDLMRFTERNIHDGILEYIPRKTADEKPVTACVPLLDRAKDLLKKYEGKDSKGRLFPFIAAQNYNYAIKEIFAKCGIIRDVEIRNPKTGELEIRPINEIASSHMARRCFVGGLYKKVKDPNLIAKMSGHVEGSKAFARYRKIDTELLAETIVLIE